MCAHLAPLAGDDPVVDPRRLVPADFARDHFDLCWKRKSGRSARGHDTETRAPPTPTAVVACQSPLATWKTPSAKYCSAKSLWKPFFVLWGGPACTSSLGGRHSSCREATC